MYYISSEGTGHGTFRIKVWCNKFACGQRQRPSMSDSHILQAWFKQQSNSNSGSSKFTWLKCTSFSWCRQTRKRKTSDGETAKETLTPNIRKSRREFGLWQAMVTSIASEAIQSVQQFEGDGISFDRERIRPNRWPFVPSQAKVLKLKCWGSERTEDTQTTINLHHFSLHFRWFANFSSGKSPGDITQYREFHVKILPPEFKIRSHKMAYGTLIDRIHYTGKLVHVSSIHQLPIVCHAHSAQKAMEYTLTKWYIICNLFSLSNTKAVGCNNLTGLSDSETP